MRAKLALCLALCLLLLAAGCASRTPAAAPSPSPSPASSPAPAPVPDESPEPAAETPASGSGVATSDQMTTVEEVGSAGMLPIPGKDVLDGVYEVAVECSSSMFRVERCTLTVSGGSMEALMTMGGTGYLYVRPGTAEEAAEAWGTEDANLIPFVEDSEGKHTFTIPVEALDAEIACAAFSKNKEVWYDRTLLFRADSLPMEAFREGVLHTPEALGLADGSYTVEVSLSGGSGRAKVVSPAPLTVEGGVCTAYVEWGSPNYDYMLVGGEKLLTVNADGNSAFLVPVALFDRPLAVTADTTAMSQAHEIEYTLFFDSSTLRPAE